MPDAGWARCRAPGGLCRHGQSTPATGCPAPTRAIGEANVASTRPLSVAVPEGAPLRQCWDPARCSIAMTVQPTLSKTAPRRMRCRRAAVRFVCLTPEVPSPRRAPRGCPLRQCWDPARCSIAMTVQPTLSKTARRRVREDGTPARGAVIGLPTVVFLVSSCLRGFPGGWGIQHPASRIWVGGGSASPSLCGFVGEVGSAATLRRSRLCGVPSPPCRNGCSGCTP